MLSASPATRRLSAALALALLAPALALAAPGDPPTPAVLPSLSYAGMLAPGASLSAQPGTWADGAPTAIAWHSCLGEACTQVATGPSYTVADPDIGRQLRVEVAAEGPGGVATALSARTQAVTGPALAAPAPADDAAAGPAPAPARRSARPRARARRVVVHRPRRARVRLAPVATRLPSGGRLLVRGHLLPTRSAGKLIQLQWRYGASWRLMSQARARAGGAFTLRYRFVRGGRYRIAVRVVVPADHGWPYPTVLSRPVSVRVG